MKIYFFICLLVLLSIAQFNITAQTVDIKIFIRNPCNNSIRKLDFFQIEKDSHVLIYNSDIDSTLKLTNTGNYILKSQYIAGLVKIKIDSFGIFRDTLIQSNVNKVFTIHKKPSFLGWICCDNKCNGYQIGYYQNGNKKVEGLFKAGKAIGEIKYFNEDGGLSYIEYYNKNGRLIHTKHLRGNVSDVLISK